MKCSTLPAASESLRCALAAQAGLGFRLRAEQECKQPTGPVPSATAQEPWLAPEKCHPQPHREARGGGGNRAVQRPAGNSPGSHGPDAGAQGRRPGRAGTAARGLAATSCSGLRCGGPRPGGTAGGRMTSASQRRRRRAPRGRGADPSQDTIYPSQLVRADRLGPAAARTLIHRGE